MKKRLCLFLATLLCLHSLVLLPVTAATVNQGVVIEDVVVDANYPDKYATWKDQYQLVYGYRIPGMVVTQNNTILVAWEVRANVYEDEGDNDIMIRRSTDGGTNFETVFRVGMNDAECFTNPTMIVGDDGRIHLLYMKDTGKQGVYYTYSDNDGAKDSWSQPVDISGAFQRAKLGWNMVNFGPGHGICLKNGENAGRLIVPMWCCINKIYYVYTLYSDDNGVTWQMSERVEGLYNETMIAELSDGGVMLNARQGGDVKNRHLSFSSTGINAWSEVRADTDLPDPGCQGSMISTTINGQHAILFVNCADQKDRTNLTVRCSLDDGKTWVSETVKIDGACGYSDIAVGSNGTVYVLYESNLFSEKAFGMLLYKFDLNTAFGNSTDKPAAFKGDGTEESPFLLEHMGDLNTLQNATDSYKTQHFKLCFDPDFGFDESKWNKNFVGIIDGNGHTVKNLTLDLFKNDQNESILSNATYQNMPFALQNYYQEGTTGADFSVRFVAELLCEPSVLSGIGFKYVITNEGRTEEYTANCSYVYRQLMADGELQSPKNGKYFLAHGIKDIPVATLVSFTVTPFIVTNSGKWVYGTETKVSFINRQANSLVVGSGDCNYQPWSSIFPEA